MFTFCNQSSQCVCSRSERNGMGVRLPLADGCGGTRARPLCLSVLSREGRQVSFDFDLSGPIIWSMTSARSVDGELPCWVREPQSVLLLDAGSSWVRCSGAAFPRYGGRTVGGRRQTWPAEQRM